MKHSEAERDTVRERTRETHSDGQRDTNIVTDKKRPTHWEDKRERLTQ